MTAPASVPVSYSPAPADRVWPASPLDAVQRAFGLLATPPATVTFEGRLVDGLPDRSIPLDELRQVLIHDTTPREVRDAAWRGIVQRARSDGPTWVLAAVGLAMPGLRRRAGRR